MASSTDTTQWLQLDFGSAMSVGGMQLTARSNSGAVTGSPTSFTIQSSTDGTTWSTIAGQSYTNDPTPIGNYYLQLGEVAPLVSN